MNTVKQQNTKKRPIYIIKIKKTQLFYFCLQKFKKCCYAVFCP